MPLILNIVGLPRIGVSTLCDRIKRCLELQNLRVSVIKLSNAKNVQKFEDAYYNKLFKHTHVVLIDNHYYTTSSIKTNRKTAMINKDTVIADYSVLVTAKSVDDYQLITHDERKDYPARQKIAGLMDNYRHCDTRFYCSHQHIVLSVNGIDDRLYAAGHVKRLIIKELQGARQQNAA